MQRFIQSLYDNIVDRSYVDAMNHVGKTMSQFRVPHFDELIILDYKSMAGTLVRTDLIHVINGNKSVELKRECLFENFILPNVLQLTNIRSICPTNAQENLDIKSLL